MSAPLLPNYFDNPPQPCITAEEVRERCAYYEQNLPGNGGKPILIYALRGLLTHPGVSSSARAVIEAALE